MSTFSELVERAIKEPACDRIFKLEPPLIRRICMKGLVGASSVRQIEAELESCMRVEGLGWFARRTARSPIVRALQKLQSPEAKNLVVAIASFGVLRLVAELVAATPLAQREQLLTRLVANVRARAGDGVVMFSREEVQEALDTNEEGLSHDEDSIEHYAGVVEDFFDGGSVRAISSGIAAALRSTDGKMGKREQRLFRAIQLGFGLASIDDSGESDCPNCGNDAFEVQSKEELGVVRKVKEFSEKTTRGIRTKVLKVGYDRVKETRRCPECSHEWTFKTDVEQ